MAMQLPNYAVRLFVYLNLNLTRKKLSKFNEQKTTNTLLVNHVDTIKSKNIYSTNYMYKSKHCGVNTSYAPLSCNTFLYAD